ncbi:MAG: PH domain-containing protein [Phycisphaerae bacterium]|nr:PH domain-containing protein [Gemmatimonadaceae bacterium]
MTDVDPIAAPADAVAGDEFRLHPWSILLNLRSELRALIFPAIAVLLAGRKSERGFFAQLVVILIIGLVRATWRYFSQRMRFDPTEFVIKSGIIRRNERRIPYARIQSVDSTRNAIQQMLGVAEIVIHTAGSAEPEAKLTVLSVNSVADFRQRIFASSPIRHADTLVATDALLDQPGAVATTARRDQVLRLSTRDLLLYGFIENRGMLLILGAIGVLFQYGPLEKMFNDALSAEFGGQGPLRGYVTGLLSQHGLAPELVLYAVVAVVLMLLFVRLLSVIWAVVRLHNFTVMRTGDALRVEYGLFTRVNGTIPLTRVQTVSTKAGVIHRMFDCVTLDVTVAQGSNLEKGGLREPLAPILPRTRVAPLVAELWPDLGVEGADWQPLHERAHIRLLRSGVSGALILGVVLFPALRVWTVLVFGAAVVWKLLTVKRVADSIRWTVSDRVFAVRSGWIAKQEIVARVQKMQVLAFSQTLFDRRNGMAGIAAHTAGGVAAVSYLPVDVARGLLSDLSAKAARTKFRL